MDTSDTYIKMCEKATEVQEHEVEEPDYYAQRNHKGHWEVLSYCYEYGEMWSREPMVWLPRQDELQEMMGFSTQTLILEFDRWLRQAKPVHQEVDKQLQISMEQLWLAFVMKGKYNKVWDGEEWIDA